MHGRPNDERGFIHKKILGLGRKLLGATPIGLAVGTGLDLLGVGGQRQVSRVPPPRLPQGTRVQFPTPGFRGAAERFLPGGRSGFTTIPEGLIPKGPGGVLGAFPGVPGGVTGFGNGAADPEGRICPPRGFHLNKSSYFLRDGTFVERETKFVRNRRLNNANGRAQNKAIVRLEKGQDHAKKLLKATGWRTISKQSTREMAHHPPRRRRRHR